ncbi:MAG: cytidylate kinase family protein [Candidatus Woesearchaeota archaeon]|nr:cytidylate kinase family protein [Candidatus Woesearchaeota archaeon]
MIITISGMAGSGKSTVGRLLARHLKMKYYCIGDMRRKMADDLGMSLAEFNKLGEKEDFTDRQVDEFQEKLGRKEDNFVIVGRTSYHFIPHSVKIFLDVKLEEGARRIFSQKRENENFKSLQDAIESIKLRDESDAKRYLKYYGINISDPKNFDLVIDTTRMPIEKIVDKIAGFVSRERSKDF